MSRFGRQLGYWRMQIATSLQAWLLSLLLTVQRSFLLYLLSAGLLSAFQGAMVIVVVMPALRRYHGFVLGSVADFWYFRRVRAGRMSTPAEEASGKP
jgi:hypothetical protein